MIFRFAILQIYQFMINKILCASLFVLVISSCSKSKDNNACYECKLALEKKEGLILVGFSNSTNIYCDKSHAEIKKLEQDQTFTKGENGITTTSSLVCTLTK